MRIKRFRTLARRATSGSAIICAASQPASRPSEYDRWQLESRTRASERAYLGCNPGAERVEHGDELDDVGCHLELVGFQPAEVEELVGRDLLELLGGQQRELPCDFGRVHLGGRELLGR